MKIGGVSLNTTSWSQLIQQLNLLKQLLGGGFVKHMQVFSFPQSYLCLDLFFFGLIFADFSLSYLFFLGYKLENELLHNLFEFTPKRKQLLGNEHCISSNDKDSPLIIECFNFNNNGKCDLIG